MKTVIAILIIVFACSLTTRASASHQETPATTTGSSAPAVVDLGNFDVLGTTVGYAASDKFLSFIHNTEAGIKQQGMFEGRGPLAILLLVFVGGLALNLTPCVLPMVPINLAIIGAGAQAGSRSRGFLLGGVYGGAMAAVYGVLGLIVILTAGRFGTLNSSPWFNAIIAAIFVVLGLAMFDVLIIDLSRFGSNLRIGSNRGTFALAFAMGAIAALLAGACVAPVILQVVLFSSNLYSKGTAIALGLPFVLGLGMGLPWPIAGAGLAALPKPGPWMVRVKQAFGVLILATAVYYGYESYSLFHQSTKVVTTQTVADKDGWYHSLPEALAAAKTENKQVLVDMWATWCKNCTVMDETTFRDATVKAAMSKYVLLKFEAEDPDVQPAKAMMDRFQSVGLPTYAILQPR